MLKHVCVLTLYLNKIQLGTNFTAVFSLRTFPPCIPIFSAPVEKSETSQQLTFCAHLFFVVVTLIVVDTQGTS